MNNEQVKKGIFVFIVFNKNLHDLDTKAGREFIYIKPCIVSLTFIGIPHDLDTKG